MKQTISRLTRWSIAAAALLATTVPSFAASQWVLPSAYPPANYHVENLNQFAKDVEAAAEVAAWMNGADEVQDALITVGGLFPSTETGLASDALLTKQPFFGDQVINEVFIDSAANTPSTWVDGPNYGTAQTAITDEFAKVINGDQTFLEALDKAQDATVADLKSRGLNVK